MTQRVPRDHPKAKHGKRHHPTAETRKMVESLTAYGIKQDEIAAILEIDRNTLMSHYRLEIDTGTPKANSQVAQRLYKKALDGDTSSMIFWLKTRGRWSETVRQEISGPDGGPVEHEHSIAESDRDILERYLKGKK